MVIGRRFWFSDSLIVAVKPKPPVKSLRDGLDDDDDDDDLVQRALFSWKRKFCHCIYTFVNFSIFPLASVILWIPRSFSSLNLQAGAKGGFILFCMTSWRFLVRLEWVVLIHLTTFFWIMFLFFYTFYFFIGRCPFDGNFLSQSKGVDYDHYVVYFGSCCP